MEIFARQTKKRKTRNSTSIKSSVWTFKSISQNRKINLKKAIKMSVCPIQFNQIGKSASNKSYKSYIDSCLPVSIKMYEFFVSLMLHPLCLRVLTLCFDISVNIDRTSLLHIRWLKSFI